MATIDPFVLLTELKALVNSAPDFDKFSPTSRIHHEWIAKLHALIQRASPLEAQKIAFASEMIGMQIGREMYLSQIMGTLHRTIASLELHLQNKPAQVFGPGAVYDFYKNFREILGTATTSVFAVDPYFDESVFDTYISSLAPTVNIRLLGSSHSKGLKPAIEKFHLQSRRPVEVRSSQEVHDRVVFIDGRSCWVIGQSLKDAAKSKPTYIAPLAADAVKLKQDHYEKIWISSLKLS